MSDRSELENESSRGRRVTVGVDGSAYANAALDWAAVEARRRGAVLHVVTVVDAVVDEVPMAEVFLDVRLRGEVGQARDLHTRLKAGFAEGRDGLEVDFELLAGDPAFLLHAAARTSELLVIGSRGRGGFAGLPLSSVSLRLARSCECPLVVVPQGHAAPEHMGPTVVGFDSGESVRVLEYATGHAGRIGGEVRVVHAWTPYPAHSSAQFVSDTDITARHSAEEIAEWLKTGHAADSGVTVRIVVERGRTDEILVGQSAQAALLVLGSHRRRVPHTPGVGAVLRHVLMHSRCPVAIVSAD